MKALEKFLSRAALLGLTMLLAIPFSAFAQEYDDLYFTSKDRKEKKVKTAKVEESAASLEVLRSYQNNAYDNTDYSSRNINPEYLSKYNNGVNDVVLEDETEEYFPEDYNSNQFSDRERYYDNTPVVNNYYGSGFPGFCAYNPYGGFYGRPRWNFGLGYTSGFYWGSGLSFSIGYGYPGFYGAFYDPFYDPFFYGSRFYDPFFYGRGFGYARFGGFYGPAFYGRSAYYRGFSNGYYAAGGDFVRTRRGREVVRGVRSNRSVRSGTLSQNSTSRSRNLSSQREGSLAPVRGRTRVTTTDISRSQNELNRGRTSSGSNTVRSRSAVTSTRSRTSTSRESYTNRRSSSSPSYGRERSSSSSTRTRQSSPSYIRSYRSNDNSSGSSYGRSRSYRSSGPTRSRSGGFSSGSNSRSRSGGFSSGSNTRSRSGGFSSGSNSRSRSGGFSSGSNSRSRSGGFSSGSNTRSRSGGFSSGSGSRSRSGGFSGGSRSSGSRSGSRSSGGSSRSRSRSNNKE